MYELHKLGWYSFQQLCLTVTREVLGQTVESFLDSGDGGRDGAFTGIWQSSKGESFNGAFVIQCKFTNKNNCHLHISTLSDEIKKVRELVNKGICDSYLLMTNAGVSGTCAAKIKEQLKTAGVRHIGIYGSSWINQQINDHKRLRMLVPRVYGLGDLSQIIDARAYRQAQAIMEYLREDLAKVVVTEAYQRAVDAINQHGFVLLIGEPAAGKTTIASMLAMAALDRWKSSVLKIDTPEDFTKHWNPDEPSQFFWLDDAFGITQHEESLTRGWNHVLPQVNAMVKKGAKIVMTSRDYIYNTARKSLKESAFPLLKESQVVIDVHALSSQEKCQILYNHLKLGMQSHSFRKSIKPYLENIASNSRFIPETARRLSNPLFTKNLALESFSLRQFVEKREQFLQEVLQGLDANSKASLAIIYMRNNHLESPIVLQPLETDAMERLNSNLGGCVAALKALDGSLVQHIQADGEAFWRFKHPTIGDAYAEMLIRNPELLKIYIHGSDPEKILSQVTCGDVDIEKAVVIPKSLFSMMLSKLDSFSLSKAFKYTGNAEWHANRELQDFLSYRCSKEFLELYQQTHTDLLVRIANPGLYLQVASEVRLAIRLHEFGILPEVHRAALIKKVSDYAIKGTDMYALGDHDIRNVFTESEYTDLQQRVRTELLPHLTNLRLDWERNCDRTESAEDYMQPFLDSLDDLHYFLREDKTAANNVAQEIACVNNWIEEQETDNTPDTDFGDLGKVETPSQSHNQRSIFDDIDVC